MWIWNSYLWIFSNSWQFLSKNIMCVQLSNLKMQNILQRAGKNPPSTWTSRQASSSPIEYCIPWQCKTDFLGVSVSNVERDHNELLVEEISIFKELKLAAQLCSTFTVVAMGDCFISFTCLMFRFWIWVGRIERIA